MEIRSSQTRKQRKFLFTAPLHLRRKIISAHLSKELKQKFKIRSFPLRKGDEVEIMRGKNKKQKGKISRIDTKNYQVFIEGIKRKRTAGTETQIPFHPSNLRIINLDLTDKKRVKAFERRAKIKISVQPKKEEPKKEESKKEEVKKEEIKEVKKEAEKIEEKKKMEEMVKSREKWRGK